MESLITRDSKPVILNDEGGQAEVMLVSKFLLFTVDVS